MKGWLPLAVAGLIACPSFGAIGARVSMIRITGTIGPATTDYVVRAVREAAGSGSQCLVVQLDTPGGLLDSTKDIVQAFYSSPVPIVVYVAPSGAGAGSGGCFITLAADVAAMAPHTNIGAAHPVSMGVGEEKPEDVMEKKLENYGVSFIETIADKRGRNVEWARSAVRDSASITAEKALDLKVIEIVARDMPDLLRQLNGRKIDGRALATTDASVVEIPMLPREHLFQALWRPEVMFILMLIAIYGIVGELSSPGAILPGVSGAIALLLAFYMAAILPVSAVGLALILLALGLFTADLVATSHGVLTAGGIIAFFLGSMFLFDRSEPAYRLPIALILPATLITSAFFLFIVGAGLRAQRRPVRAGCETMIGLVVPALTAIDAKGGRVSVEGELWGARCETPVREGEPVEVVGLEGLILNVKPKS